MQLSILGRFKDLYTGASLRLSSFIYVDFASKFELSIKYAVRDFLVSRPETLWFEVRCTTVAVIRFLLESGRSNFCVKSFQHFAKMPIFVSRVP